VGMPSDSCISTGAAIDKAGDAVFTKVDQVSGIVDDSAITASIKADLLKRLAALPKPDPPEK